MFKSRRKAPIWRHFTSESTGKRATCNYCKQSLSTQDGNTTNCKSHLQSKHTAIFLKLGREDDGPEDDSQDPDDPDPVAEVVLNSDGDGRPTPTQSPSPSPSFSRAGGPLSPSPGPCFSPPPSPSLPGGRRPGSANSFHQESLDSFTAPDSRLTEKLHLAVTHYIASCERPLNTVEKDGFKDMLATFKPGYKILSRRTLTDKYIPRLVEQVKAYLRSLLKAAVNFALTSDNWTSTADVPFTALTAHFIAAGWDAVEAVTLCCRATRLGHAGLDLRDFFQEELAAWSLHTKDVSAITTDNAPEMRLSAELLEIPHMRCFGHTVQNGVTDLFEVPEVKAALAAMKVLATWLEIPRVWKAYEKYVLTHHGGKALAIPSTSPTRWWSELHQIERVIEMHEYLLPFAASFDRGKYLPKVPGSQHMFALREVARTLKPIENICTNLCGDTYITASAVLPVLHLLEAGFVDDDDPPEVPLDIMDDFIGFDEDALKPVVLRQHIVKKLKKRYCPEPLDTAALDDMTPQLAAVARIDHRCALKARELLSKCSYLDPRYRDELLPDEIALARQLLVQEYLATAAPQEGNEQQQPSTGKGRGNLGAFFAKKRRVNDDGEGDGPHASSAPATPEQRFLDELNRFADIPTVSMDVDVRLWWKERVETYPLLEPFARKYLAIPATSTTSERLFSHGGNVVTDTRNCLSDGNAGNLIFLSSNRRFLKKR